MLRHLQKAKDEMRCDPCTHVLALRSRPDAIVLGKAASFLERQLLAKSLRKYGEELYQDYIRRARQYADDIALLQEHARDHSLEPSMYQVLVPAITPTVSPFERRRDVLVHSAAAGMKAMVAALMSR